MGTDVSDKQRCWTVFGTSLLEWSNLAMARKQLKILGTRGKDNEEFLHILNPYIYSL